MASREFDRKPARAKPALVPESEAPERAALLGGTPHVAPGAEGDPRSQAAALTQAAGGQFDRAGDALLQLQHDYGNHHVQRVINHSQVRPDAQPESTHSQTNPTGLPDRLKAGVEALSGLSLDDVRVHYDSAKPAALQALAYTQGTNIHVGPGQEQHLAHEAWHAVQQRQGRVKPTLQAKGVAINDDLDLEREADLMGERARQTGEHATSGAGEHQAARPSAWTLPSPQAQGEASPIQMKFRVGSEVISNGKELKLNPIAYAHYSKMDGQQKAAF